MTLLKHLMDGLIHYLKEKNTVFTTMAVEGGDVDTTTVDDWKKFRPM